MGRKYDAEHEEEKKGGKKMKDEKRGRGTMEGAKKAITRSWTGDTGKSGGEGRT